MQSEHRESTNSLRLLTKNHTDVDNHQQQTKLDIQGNQTEVDLIVSGQSPQVLSKSTYDLVRDVLTTTDGNNLATNYQYDALSELIGVTPPSSAKTNYVYDTRGLQKSTSISGDNSTTQKSYDELGRLVSETDGEGKVDKYTYDGNGNIKTHTDHKGQVTTFTYDSRDRLIKKTTGTDTITYAYDGLGRRTSMTDDTGTTTYTYNYLDKLTQVALPDSLTTTYQYDQTGSKRMGMTDPFSQTIAYGKDSLDRITQVSLGNTANPAEAMYAYSGSVLNQLTEGDNAKLTNTYDQLDHLTNISGTGVSGLTTYNYGYDNNGNITTKSDNVGSYTYTYDTQNRVTQQKTSQNVDTYAYDLRGNRKTVTSSTPMLPQLNKYQYDGWNQLTKVTAANGKVVTYRYNGDGLLYERTDANGTTRYYYDDNQNVIADATVTNGTPTLNARYIRGANDQLVARQAADGSKAYYTLNGHGDVTELRDSNGTVLNTYYYDIWGNPTTTTETVANPFRYSGELWDSTTGLQYLRARWYDPSQGRFLSKDTDEGKINTPLTLNQYS